MTRTILSVLLVTSALFVVGCGKKKNKAAQVQKETVTQQFVKQERAAASKEEYAIAA